jgi:hypothetical protein
VIRQRNRSDRDCTDEGQIITWDLRWQWTPTLVEEANGGAGCDVTRVSRADAVAVSTPFGIWPIFRDGYGSGWSVAGGEQDAFAEQR